MSKFVELVDQKRINLLGIGGIPKEELLNIAKTVGLENVNDKALELIRKEIEHLGKLSLAGQVFFSEIAILSWLFSNFPDNFVKKKLYKSHFSLNLGVHNWKFCFWASNFLKPSQDTSTCWIFSWPPRPRIWKNSYPGFFGIDIRWVYFKLIFRDPVIATLTKGDKLEVLQTPTASTVSSMGRSYFQDRKLRQLLPTLLHLLRSFLRFISWVWT